MQKNIITSRLAKFFAVSALCVTFCDAHAQLPIKNSVDSDALPKVKLTGDVLSAMIKAGLAIRRNELPLAFALYIELALQTKDYRFAQRASWIARERGDVKSALNATRLWMKLAPKSVEAKVALGGLLNYSGSLAQAQSVLMVARDQLKDQIQIDNFYNSLRAELPRAEDKKSTLMLAEKLIAPHQQQPYAQLLLLLLSLEASDMQSAETALRKLIQINPEDPQLALMIGNVQVGLGGAWVQSAQTYFKQYLEKHPDAYQIKAAYLKLLLAKRNDPNLIAAMDALQKLYPQDGQLGIMLIGLEVEQDQLDKAQSRLDAFLNSPNLTPADIDGAYYYQGQIAEKRKKPDLALSFYSKVTLPENALFALRRQVHILREAKREVEALALVQKFVVQKPEDNETVALLQSYLFRALKQTDKAYAVVSAALKDKPNSADLLYEQAIAADMLGRFAELERNARKIMLLLPKSSMGYNLLGYALAERNERLSESLVLLERAVRLDPNNPQVIDSLGWAYYRLGDLKRAKQLLEGAYAKLPDIEIGIHLAEVLWAQGEQEKARELWRTLRKNFPNNPELEKTLSRLGVKL